MRAASPPRQMERENEMIVISHRLFRFYLIKGRSIIHAPCIFWMYELLSSFRPTKFVLNTPKSLEPLGTFSTNPINQTDGYGQRHTWRPREPCVTLSNKKLVTHHWENLPVMSHQSRITILKETLIKSLSDFTLEFLYMTRNSLTRIASYLRKAMTKSCIKILVESDSAIESAFP